MGTGKAWAGHKSAKLSFACLRNEMLVVSDENDGAFVPTGSIIKY